MATHQLERLVKIGREGFGLIEEIYGRQADHLARIGREGFGAHEELCGHAGQPKRNGKPPPARAHLNPRRHPNPNQQQFVYHGPQMSTVTVMVPPITFNEVAKYHDDNMLKEPVMSSDHAAQYYDGMVIMDYRRKNSFRGA